MKAVHGPRMTGPHPCHLFIFAILLTIGSWGHLYSSTDKELPPSGTTKDPDTYSDYVSIAVFPLKNETGESELDWLSIGLQEHLSRNLSSVSHLHTRKFFDLISFIRKHCPAMTLTCLTGQKSAADENGNSLHLPHWQVLANEAHINQFIWGSYRLHDEVIEVSLSLYAGEHWAPEYEVTFTAPLAELSNEVSQKMLDLLLSRGITIMPEEHKHIMSVRPELTISWEMYTLHYLMDTYQRAHLWKEGLNTATTLELFFADPDRAAEKMALVQWQAIFLRELNLFEESKSAYYEVLAFKEKTLGPDHPDVATIVSTLAFLNKATGDNGEAEKLFKRAINIDEKVVGPEDPLVAERVTNLALFYHALGDYDRALPLYERSLAIHKQAYGKQHQEMARDLSNLAKLSYDRGNYSKARTLYEQALEINVNIFGNEHPEVAQNLSNLAGVYYGLGKYTQAQTLYERCLSIDENIYGYQHPEVAKDLSNLAGIFYTRGKYAPSKLLYERALAINETTYGNENPEVAKDLNNLARIYQVLGDYKKALSLYQQSLSLSEKFYGNNDPRVAIVLNNVAELHAHLGDYEQALPLYERALSINRNTYGQSHPHVSTVLNNLAGLHYALAEYTQAKTLYEESLAIDQDIYGNEHPRVAIRLNNLAEFYCTIDQHEKAQPLYEQALLVAQTSGQPDLLWRVQFNLGYMLSQQQKPYAAIFFGKQAVNTLQEVRADMSDLENELEQSFLKTKWHVYKFLADLLIDFGRLPEAQLVLDMQKEEEYFEFLCRDARRQDVRRTRAPYTDEELSWSERYREISEHIASLGKEYASLKKKKKFGFTDNELQRYTQLTDDLKVARKAFSTYLVQLVNDLSTVSRERYAEIRGKRLDKPRKLQQALQELGHGAVVIHYLVLEDKLRIILTTPEIQLARDIDISAKDLNHKIMAFRKIVQNPRANPLDRAEELYKIIFAPIDQDLMQSGAQTVMLSLDGTLRYLPLAALHDGERYLIEKYQLSLYTAAAGLDIKDRPTRRWLVGGFGLSRAVRNLDPLPYVPDELEGIVRRNVSDHDGVLPGVIYLDDSFSQETLESVLTEEFPVVHIASHFELKPGTKDDSHLVMGNGKILTLAEIKENDYDFGDVEMLTLSACNTAVGDTKANGSEVESFGTLAQDQGAKGVLATLWPVADRSTGILMKHFYRLHKDQPGMTKAAALRHAQLLFIKGESAAGTLEETTRGMSVREVKADTSGEDLFTPDDKNPYTHPFYWAPFILMGNWL